MTYYDPNKPKDDDGFVSVPQQAPGSFTLPEANFVAPNPLPYTTPQPAKKSKGWVIALVIILVLLCCCCVIVVAAYYFFYYLGYTLDDFTLISPLLTLL